jgi:hypothetical protein
VAPLGVKRLLDFFQIMSHMNTLEFLA